MNSALDPLDLVKHSAKKEILAQYLDGIVQEALHLISRDYKQEFLYKNPNGWQQRRQFYNANVSQRNKTSTKNMQQQANYSDSSSSSMTFTDPSSSTTSQEYETDLEPWSCIANFEFSLVVRQINEFIQTWELGPATKFVVIALDKIENIKPFGERYFVEAHFSKPTPKCPNPLAVAKVYFEINVSHLLSKVYPVNVTYKFEGYKSQFYAMGKNKLSSKTFQRYYIDSILHMKLAFYAELCKCRNPLKPVEKFEK